MRRKYRDAATSFIYGRTIEGQMALFLLRYAEMGLKSEKVRRRFQQALIENIENHFVRLGAECLVSWDRGRVFVMSDDVERARKVFSHTFGIVSFSEAEEADTDIEELIRSVVSYSEQRLSHGNIFAIRARRSGQQKYTSMELARRAGEAVLDALKNLQLKVDLEEPQVEIFIDAREKGAYLYSETEMGPGGLPLGTQGTVLCQVQSTDGVLAAWMMMRRGCKVMLLAEDSALAAGLHEWDPSLQIIQKKEGESIHALAKRNGCKGIAYALDYGEIAASNEAKEGLAHFYPLTGLSKGEKEKLLEKVL